MKVLVVGTGPSGWAVITGMKSLENVYLIDGGERFKSHKSQKDLLGKKLKFSSGHSYAIFPDFDLNYPGETMPASLSRGGLSEVWGSGFTPFDINEMDTNFPLSKQRLTKSMKEILDLLEYSFLPSEIDTRFNYKDIIPLRLRNFNFDLTPKFRQLLCKLENRAIDDLLVGQPSFLLNKSDCTNCGLCLSGCPYGIFFDAGEAIDELVYRSKLSSKNILSGYVTKLEPQNSGILVYYLLDGIEFTALFDEVILSAGVISSAMILMRSQLLAPEFLIPDSQVFYSALISLRNFGSSKIAEVANLVVYPKLHNSEDFQVSIYPPSETSRKRVLSIIFGESSLGKLVPRSLTNRLIPMIGSLPQSVSGQLLLKLNERGRFSMVRITNHKSKKATSNTLKSIRKLFRKQGLFTFSFLVQIPEAGSGFHIGASMPLGGEVLDEHARLRKQPNIRILDPSLLPYLPAGAHTFLTMACIRALIQE